MATTTVNLDKSAPYASEAELALFLSRSTLPNRLKWKPSDPDEGWHEWTGTHWSCTKDPIPLPLITEIKRAIAHGMDMKMIERREVSKLEQTSAMRGVATQLMAYQTMRLPKIVDPPDIIALPSSRLNLRTGERLAHDPAEPITRVCPVEPTYGSPLWPLIEDHLRSCLGDVYDAVWHFLGSSLLGCGADRRILWLCGPGGDGKSTLNKLLKSALGGYFADISAESVKVGGSSGSHGNELRSGLITARLASAAEVGDVKLDWANLKGLSGGDAQVTKRAYGRALVIERPPCMMLISNHEPKPPDNAAAERLIVARMTPPERRDSRLISVLMRDCPERDTLASACLAWLIDGCFAFVAADNRHPVIPKTGQVIGLMEAWLDEAIAAGRVVRDGVAWSPLTDFLPDIRECFIKQGVPIPTDKEASRFLDVKLGRHHFRDGWKYGAAVKR